MPYFHYEVCMIYHRKYRKKQEEKAAEKVFSAKTLHLIYGVKDGLQKEETKKEIEQAPAPVNNNHQNKNHQKNKNKQGRR